MFFSPPFSCSASLCEQLLAGGSGETPAYSLLGILTYYFFLLLTPPRLRIPQGLEDCRITASFYSYRDYRSGENDWKTAVLLLPFTTGITTEDINRIGILPYYYFLLLLGYCRGLHSRLEDCRIYTSFYLTSSARS